MNHKLAINPGTKKPKFPGIHFIAIIICSFCCSIQNLQAQSYVQVPVSGGVSAPVTTPPNFTSFGPFAQLNIRAAMLYKASEMSHFPVSYPLTSLAFKLNGSVYGQGTTGYFKIYLIPTTDTVYNLGTDWDTIMLHPNLTKIGDYHHLMYYQLSGYMDYPLTSPYYFNSGEGFYLLYEWESQILAVVSPPFECNTDLINGYYQGTNNSHNPQTAPTTLNQIGNYRHVLRLGYNGPTGISEMNSNNAVNVFPNPAHEILNVDLSMLKNTATQLTLRDLTGKVVKMESLKNKQNQISLTGITPGIYSLHLASSSETKVQRIIIK
ncbi:T9SS type A sorting domain-containing protein [Adhaeribacter soli]|uniref:T9SS type A sorting domain-containing protein n=1 Tax=Adhaeribacter soli TaxID=2607655 RepID=A0A5N1IYJ7_9BACT|nr:T9SS type A sorting domain-containing protein [Adhaeribacter soli]KAA9333559.1 T9SS type A sorting domain-containing protein [Adhaeribacter soli]